MWKVNCPKGAWGVWLVVRKAQHVISQSATIIGPYGSLNWPCGRAAVSSRSAPYRSQGWRHMGDYSSRQLRLHIWRQCIIYTGVGNLRWSVRLLIRLQIHSWSSSQEFLYDPISVNWCGFRIQVWPTIIKPIAPFSPTNSSPHSYSNSSPRHGGHRLMWDLLFSICSQRFGLLRHLV